MEKRGSARTKPSFPRLQDAIPRDAILRDAILRAESPPAQSTGLQACVSVERVSGLKGRPRSPPSSIPPMAPSMLPIACAVSEATHPTTLSSCEPHGVGAGDGQGKGRETKSAELIPEARDQSLPFFLCAVSLLTRRGIYLTPSVEKTLSSNEVCGVEGSDFSRGPPQCSSILHNIGAVRRPLKRIRRLPPALRPLCPISNSPGYVLGGADAAVVAGVGGGVAGVLAGGKNWSITDWIASAQI
jgi:hypothetical protein